MSRLIDFGKLFGGVVSFPDDATDDQIVEQYNTVRVKAIGSAKLNLEGALSDVEQQQPSLEKYLIRTGLGFGEQAVGGLKQMVGNIARTAADVFAIPQTGLQRVPDTSDPELPINVLREAGMSLEQEGSAQRKSATELGESIGGGVGPAIAENLAGTAGVSSTTLPVAVFGLGPAAVAAAVQSYTLNLSDFRDILKQRNPELTEEQAFQQAQVPAALTGAATGVLTRGFGGVERFVEKIAKDGIGKEGVKALLRDAFRSATLEFPEEYGDQLAQGFVEKAYINPDKPVGEIFNEAGMAGLSGFALGGLTTGAIASPFVAADAITKPSRMRRGTERRQEVISSEVAKGNLLPEGTPAVAALRTPQGETDVAPVNLQVGIGDVSPEQARTQAQTPEGFGSSQSRSDEEVKYLSAQLGEVTTLEHLLRTAINTSGNFDHRIYKGLRHIHDMVVNEAIAGGGEQGIKITVKESDGSHYQGRTNTININPSTAGSRTVMHEAVHGLSGRYLNRFLGSGIYQGSELRNHLKKALKDKSVPDNVKELINIYFAAAKHIGIESDLFGGKTRREVVARTNLASLDSDGYWSISTGSSGQERLAKFRDTLARAYGPIDYVTDPYGNLVLKLSNSQMERLKFDGIAETTSGPGTTMMWVSIPGVEQGMSKGVAGSGGLAQRTASAGLPYGMANLDEFLAEAFSNEEFQLLLDSMPSINGKTLWSRFMDWLKSVFPFFSEDPTLLADTIAVGEEIFKRTIELQNTTYVPRQYGKPKTKPVPFTEDLGERLPAPNQPQFFKTREQVEAAVQNPGLTPAQQQQATDLAAVQASMSPDSIVGWLMQTPADAVERFAQRRLSYIEERRYLENAQRALASMPETTPEEVRAKQVAGATILGHYGLDRSTELDINKELETDHDLMAVAALKLGKLNINQLKANFLTALFNRLTSDYRLYLNDLTAAAPASGNVQSVYQQNLATAERRLNEQAVSPIAVQRALSAIAANLPTNLLAQGTTNQQIIDWVNQNGILFNVVGDQVREWMMVNDGTGSPALIGYTRFREDMNTLRDLLQNQQAVANDIQAFESWFRPSGRTGKVSAKNFAENYFKFRTARDRAMKIVTAIEKEIDSLDTRIRGNIMARNRLQSMMAEDAYVTTVRLAAKKADVVVRALYETSHQRSGNGLIDRDSNVGYWRMKGPMTETEYVVDLHPSSAQEAANRQALSAFVSEADDYAATHADDNPLLADEYSNLSDYIKRFLMHPSLDPSQGFVQTPWMQIPGTTIRVQPDPFDFFTAGMSFIGMGDRTVRDMMERIGGRTARQAMSDAYQLDTVMKKVQGLSANKVFGLEAQTIAVMKAIQSHGWTTDKFQLWDEIVAEKVLAAAQNNLGPEYNIGDVIVGSGVEITKEDIGAFKLMKQWEDAVLAAMPSHIRDELGDLYILRKASGSGRFTVSRLPAVWARSFINDWSKQTTDADKLDLLSKNRNFERVVMGLISEFNPEFSKMNPASPNKSPLFDIYRRLALTIKQGVQTFSNINDVLDFIANEMVSRNISPDFTIARTKAQETLLSEIDNFTTAFQNEVLNYKSNAVWGGVPDAVVQISSANNSFTTPRGNLVAPSTFYTYSVGSDGRRLAYLGGLRSLLNLKVLQSLHEALKAMENKKVELQSKIQKLVADGTSLGKATKQILKQSMTDRKAGQIRYDYLELDTAIRHLNYVIKEMQRVEITTPDHYPHAGIEAMNNVFGAIKSGLLANVQAVSTNTWSGLLLGPAMIHLQTGHWFRAMRDVAPFFVGGTPRITKTLFKMVSAMFANNPVASKLLRSHIPIWESLAGMVVDASADWARVQRIAEMNGMVSPYNLKQKWKNQSNLKSTGGRFTANDDPGVLATFFNTIMSLPGPRHIIEPIKTIFPRKFDDFINYSLILGFEHDLNFLKKLGWVAFQKRESSAPAGHDWKDLTNPANVLTPKDLGIGSDKAMNRWQELFSPLGSLDAVLLDYYERTKSMTEEQRDDEPLITNENDYAGLALYHASVTNVATETTRPHAYRGGGNEGVLKNMFGTFAGWPANFMKQLSKVIYQTHSGDKKANLIATNAVMIAIVLLLLASVGAWNWEAGDWLNELITNQSSSRIQPGNVEDARTAMGYLAQALVNVVPRVGPILGSFTGTAVTGRGSPFDAVSQYLHLNLASDTYNTVKRIIQTGDVTLPMSDYARRWFAPTLSKSILNRVPILRGLVDQQNAVRSLNGSAPPGTEIKWGQRGGSMVYGPANDEIQKLIAQAYEVSGHGGTEQDLQTRYQDAINAYVKQGQTPEQAVRSVASALSSKEPIRILTGKEMTPEEEQRWVKRMTSEQKRDYDKAVAAWRVLSGLTGRDFEMVSTPSGGGGGGGGGGSSSRVSPITGQRISRTGGLLRLARPAGMSLSIDPGFPSVGSVGLPRIGRTRRTRTGRRTGRTRLRKVGTTRVRSPRISRKRTGLASRRRLRYSLA